MNGEDREYGDGASGYARRIALTVGIVVGIAALLALVVYAVKILLLGFAGILLAVLLRAAANLLSRQTRLPGKLSLLVAIILFALLIGLGGWFIAAPLARQIKEFISTLPQTVTAVQQQLHRYVWGEWLMNQMKSFSFGSPQLKVLGRMTSALTGLFGLLADAVIILFLGIYLAFEPETYISGFIRLVPLAERPRMREVVDEIRHTLQWWLIGIICSMSVIGVMSGVGLWLMGIPFALSFGLLAGILSFIPYLGAMISAIPAMLVALTLGPENVLYVMLLYLAIHTVEGYLLTPIVQKYAVALPPALLLFAQILMGILLGWLGLILATPMAAAILVVVRMLYIEDILGDREAEG